ALVDLVLPEGIADVLDRVLGGQDLDARLVDAPERAEERGALARAGRAGDQDDAGGRPEELAQAHHDGRAQAEPFDRLGKATRVEDPDHGALAVVAGNDRDAEIDGGGLPVPRGQARAEASVLGPPRLRAVGLAAARGQRLE